MYAWGGVQRVMASIIGAISTETPQVSETADGDRRVVTHRSVWIVTRQNC